MTRKRRKRAAVLRDLGRLVAPLDVVYHVGNMVFKRSLRYTAFTAAISIVGTMAKRFNLPGLTVRQAILLPLTVGALTLVGGYLMKVVPSLISSRLLAVAQANDLNLMEDYRKSEMPEHLEILWERLFRHECRLRLAAGLPAFPGSDPGESDADALARAREEFIARAGAALGSPEPQIRQMHVIGLDLRYLEDWRDGAYLDRSDTKLIEQFDGNATLLAARRAAGLTGPATTARFAPRRAAEKLWFATLTRMVAIQVGTAVEALNRQYATDLFNSQALLWPEEEDQPWLAAFDGARAALLRRRRQAIRRVFGPDFNTARAVLDHMLYACFARSTELRMRYDPDYCDGGLGYDVLSDLRAEGRDPRDLLRAERFCQQARRDLATFGDLLRAGRGELLDQARADDLRAVRIAFHTDAGGLRTRLCRRAAEGGSDGQLIASVAGMIDQAAAEKDAHARRLIAVRLHHELTRLARRGYRKLIKALAYAD